MMQSLLETFSFGKAAYLDFLASRRSFFESTSEWNVDIRVKTLKFPLPFSLETPVRCSGNLYEF